MIEKTPNLDDILRLEAEKSEASGVADSLQIEGIPTTPEEIHALHGLSPDVLAHAPDILSQMNEVEAHFDALFRLTGVWTSVAVEIENPLKVPKKEIVEHIAKTHDRRSS